MHEQSTWRNLPRKKQLLLLSLCRLSAPLSNACLLPYLYFLVKSIISEPDHPAANQRISRWTGLLVAAFPVGQVLTSILLGKLSDSYGRKPIILLGLTVSIVANLAFGFSRTLGTLLIWRVVAGMANGTLGVMRTMTAEIVKERKYHARAFLAPPVVFNSGRVVALIIGGCLADPVHNLPKLFGARGLFNVTNHPGGVAWTLHYPYALPALFNGFTLASCLILVTLWMRETMPSKDRRKLPFACVLSNILHIVKQKCGWTTKPEYALIAIEDIDERNSGATTPAQFQTLLAKSDHEENSATVNIWTRHLKHILANFSLLHLHNATFVHIFPVFLSMPVAITQRLGHIHFTGGLGLASPAVGIYLAMFGILGIILQLFLYPRIHNLIGTLGILRFSNLIFLLSYISVPYLVLLSEHITLRWFAMAAVLTSQIMARTMSIPSSIMLLTDAAPHRNVLGTVHGAGNTLSALASTCGPIIGGFLLAKGIEIGVVGLVWWAWLSTVCVFAILWSFILTQNKKGGLGIGDEA